MKMGRKQKAKRSTIFATSSAPKDGNPEATIKTGLTGRQSTRRKRKPAPDRTESEAERRRFLLEHAYHFKEFQGILGQIKKLPGIEGVVSDGDLRWGLGQIVETHRRRYEGNYFEKVRQCVDEAKALSDRLRSMLEMLAGLDATHMQEWMQWLALFSSQRFTPTTRKRLGLDKIELMKVLEQIAILSSVMKLHWMSLMLATGVGLDEPQPRRGRPALPYTAPTGELAALWEELTNKPAVSPKGTAQGKDGTEEASQPSTQFIYLALKMIHSNVTVSNAMTSIKAVRSRAKVFQKMLKLVPTLPIEEDE
jgi:hypothetical protein